MTTQEQIQALRGEYYVISPYHKNRKKLPFLITGRTHDPNYPVEVNTVEYKGWTPRYFTTGYKLETIQEFITSGLIKKHQPR